MIHTVRPSSLQNKEQNNQEAGSIVVDYFNIAMDYTGYASTVTS